MNVGKSLQCLDLREGMKLVCVAVSPSPNFKAGNTYTVVSCDEKLFIKNEKGFNERYSLSLFEIVNHPLREIKVDLRKENGHKDDLLYNNICQALTKDGGNSIHPCSTTPNFIYISKRGIMTGGGRACVFEINNFKEVKLNFKLDYTIEEVDTSKKDELSSIISELEGQLNIAKAKLEKL